MKRAAEWFLTHKEIPLERAPEFITQHPSSETAKAISQPDEPIGPALYDTALSADEGLWIRTGWAGRG